MRTSGKGLTPGTVSSVSCTGWVRPSRKKVIVSRSVVIGANDSLPSASDRPSRVWPFTPSTRSRTGPAAPGGRVTVTVEIRLAPFHWTV